VRGSVMRDGFSSGSSICEVCVYANLHPIFSFFFFCTFTCAAYMHAEGVHSTTQHVACHSCLFFFLPVYPVHLSGATAFHTNASSMADTSLAYAHACVR